MLCLSEGGKSLMIMCIRLDTIPEYDGRADGRTDGTAKTVSRSVMHAEAR